MYEFLVQYAGFLGVTIVLIAHFCFAFDFLSNSGRDIKVYTILSIIGSSLFLFSSFLEGDLIFIILNMFGILIAFLGFFHIKVFFPYSVKTVLLAFVCFSLVVFFLSEKESGFGVDLLGAFAFSSSFLIVLNFFMYLNGVINKVGNILVYMLSESILLAYALIVNYEVAIYSQVGFSIISIFALSYLYIRHRKMHGPTSIYAMAIDSMYKN